MCNEPYAPKVTNVNSKINEVATYTSPFGEDQQTSRPQTRAKSRTKPRTPYVQSAPSLQLAKRPRARKRPSTQESSISVYLSLPNTPDNTDENNPMRDIYRTNPHLVPGLSSETYI